MNYEEKQKENIRKEIIKMVGKIENQDYLFKIYHYIFAKYKRENKKEETEN